MLTKKNLWKTLPNIFFDKCSRKKIAQDFYPPLVITNMMKLDFHGKSFFCLRKNRRKWAKSQWIVV